VPGADRTRRHPSSRPPDYREPDLCDHPRSSTPGLLLLPRSSSLHVMPHLPPAHHETSKHDSPNEAKIKEKHNETVPDSNSNLAKSMTHHNQTKKLTTWFLSGVWTKSARRSPHARPLPLAPSLWSAARVRAPPLCSAELSLLPTCVHSHRSAAAPSHHLPLSLLA
jgi:hypothetical protein